MRRVLSGLFCAALLSGCSGDGPSGPSIGPPESVVIVSGSGQAALAGTAVALPIVVQVRDASGNGVPSVPVVFAVVKGGGSVSPSSVLTDEAGNATSSWVLGRSAVEQQISASTGSFSVLASATVSTNYDVDLRFTGPPMPAAASAAFQAAAARVRAMVTGDVPDISAGTGADLTPCGVTGQTLSGTVDDIVIYAAVMAIDGPGKVLANAGPCYIRNAGGQTIVGVMQFDSADIQPLIDKGLIQDVILHEMVHVVGFGTLWTEHSLLSGAGTADSRYVGVQGIAACRTIGATCSSGTVLEELRLTRYLSRPEARAVERWQGRHGSEGAEG